MILLSFSSPSLPSSSSSQCSPSLPMKKQKQNKEQEQDHVNIHSVDLLLVLLYRSMTLCNVGFLLINRAALRYILIWCH